MNQKEWLARKRELLRKEEQQPLKWHYLSFANEEGFLGGAFVKAKGFVSAIDRTHELGINPGGQVLVAEVQAIPPPEAQNKLLTIEDIQRIFGGAQKMA